MPEGGSGGRLTEGVPRLRRVAPTVALLLLVSGVAVAEGGFGDTAYFALILGSGMALLFASFRHPEPFLHALAKPPVVALGCLSVLGTISLLWSPSSWDSAILHALLPGALACIAIFISCACRGDEQRLLVESWLAVLATIFGLSGLVGLALEQDPLAIILGGHWRPAGFIEYSPALAFLQVAAMPVLALGARADGLAVRITCVLSLSIGGSVTILTGDRTMLLAAASLIVCWLLWPQFSLGANRREAVRCALLWGVGGLLVALTLRSSVPVAALLTLAVVAAADRYACPVRGPGLPSVPKLSGRLRNGLAVAAVMLIVAAAGSALLLESGSSEGVQGRSGIDHGRVELWGDSLRVAAEKPILGHGQASYYLVTRTEQSSPVRFAHNMVVESAVETGLVGALLFILVLAGSTWLAWQRRFSPQAWLFTPGVLAYVLLALVDWTWYLSGVSAIWAVCLGALIATDESGSSDSG